MVMSGKRDTTIPAGEFKAKCLAILDQVQAGGGSVTVTKRGKPVARVVPISVDRKTHSLAGSVLHEDDLIMPLHDVWNVES
jgi:prevent-host-death family protein